jgi:hypothetical protein
MRTVRSRVLSAYGSMPGVQRTRVAVDGETLVDPAAAALGAALVQSRTTSYFGLDVAGKQRRELESFGVDGESLIRHAAQPHALQHARHVGGWRTQPRSAPIKDRHHRPCSGVSTGQAWYEAPAGHRSPQVEKVAGRGSSGGEVPRPSTGLCRLPEPSAKVHP